MRRTRCGDNPSYRPFRNRIRAARGAILMYSRRSFAKNLFSGLAVSTFAARHLRSASADSTVKGVRLGAITGSIGPIAATPGKDNIDATIEHCVESGVASLELGNGYLEPRV